jgi:hypothetical protein
VGAGQKTSGTRKSRKIRKPRKVGRLALFWRSAGCKRLAHGGFKGEVDCGLYPLIRYASAYRSPRPERRGCIEKTAELS